MELWETLAAAIADATGEPFEVEQRQSVGGGCINSACRLSGGGRDFFVKLNSRDRLEMFEAEADGLRELRRAGAIRVPEPLATGVAAGQAYIVMEALALGVRGDDERFGRELAQLHRHCSGRFGWFRDNTIGSTPQSNTESGEWIAFWREQRLGAQLRIAAQKGHGGQLQRLGEQLLADFPALFSDYRPQPSLLHGDLWSGNYAYTRDGEPVLFDPAVYYGDREADMAMTELFGGFGSGFYAAYGEAWPLDPGYRVRKSLYNLYHILNHLNLFGGGYGDQAITTMKRLLAELR